MYADKKTKEEFISDWRGRSELGCLMRLRSDDRTTREVEMDDEGKTQRPIPPQPVRPRACAARYKSARADGSYKTAEAIDDEDGETLATNATTASTTSSAQLLSRSARRRVVLELASAALTCGYEEAQQTKTRRFHQRTARQARQPTT